MDIGLLCVLWGMTILTHFTFRNSAIGLIKRISINTRYYPKRYVTPPKWMRKLFGVWQRVIPRFLFTELLFSLGIVLFGPIYTIVVCWVKNKEVLGIVIGVHVCIIIMRTVFLAIMSTIYRRKK